MFEQMLKDFLTDYRCTVLAGLKTSSSDYRQLIENRSKYSLNLILQASRDNTALETLLENYRTCINDIQDIEGEYLYLQGFKDCITLLGTLDVV
jgi:hypothetical protein